MSRLYQELCKCYEAVRDRLPFQPEIALVLGSGLGAFAGKLEQAVEMDYGTIPGFPVSTVAGHEGKFVFGTIGEKRVVCMQGRVHFYEGYPMAKVVLPVRLMRKMGAETLILTNAAGGINRNFTPGDLMLITDHISDFVPSPLIGENMDELGVRFPDMSAVYDPGLRRHFQQTAESLAVSLREGVYIQLSGPNYETPAEIRMCERLGADAVGMSTAVEAMAAVHCGFRVCGISLISNMACGISAVPLTHEEVKRTADAAEEQFTRLIYEGIRSL